MHIFFLEHVCIQKYFHRLIILQMEMNSNPNSVVSPKKSSIRGDETAFKQSLG